MRRRNYLIFTGGVIILVIITLGIWLWPGSGERRHLGQGDRAWERATAPANVASSPDPASARIAAASTDHQINYVPEVIALARRLNAPETDGQFDLGILQELFETVARFSKDGVPEG